MSRETSSFALPSASRRGLPYLTHVHSFRAIAIVAVVATHVIDHTDWSQVPPLRRSVATCVFQNGSVLFVFIAGLLFQYLSAGFSFRKYLSSKLRFVIVPYLLASTPTLLHQYVRRFGIFAPNVYHGNLAETLVRALVRASHLPRPFWFIPMIALFYLLAPAFLWLDRRARLYLLVIPASLVIAGFAHRPLALAKPLHAFVYFLPSYLAGMAAGRYQTVMNRWLVRPWLRWTLTVVSLGFILLETVVLQRSGALWSEEMFQRPLTFDVNQISKLVLTLALLAWLATAPKLLHRSLFLLGEVSFGVFFVHEYVLLVMDRLLGDTVAGTIPLLLFGTAVTTAVSVAFVWTIKRITGKRSRYLVGS